MIDVVFLWGGLRKRAKKQIMYILQHISRELYIIQINLQDLGEIRTLSKTLRHYCLGELISSKVKAKKYCLAPSTGILRDALHKSVTVKNLLPVGMYVSSVWGLETTGCGGITVFTALRSWTNLHPQQLSFLSGKMGMLQGLVQGSLGFETCNLQLWALCLEGLLYLLVLITSGKRFYLNLDGRCDMNIANISWRFCP